jgi:hypothetical protein
LEGVRRVECGVRADISSRLVFRNGRRTLSKDRKLKELSQKRRSKRDMRESKGREREKGQYSFKEAELERISGAIMSKYNSRSCKCAASEPAQYRKAWVGSEQRKDGMRVWVGERWRAR